MRHGSAGSLVVGWAFSPGPRIESWESLVLLSLDPWAWHGRALGVSLRPGRVLACRMYATE